MTPAAKVHGPHGPSERPPAHLAAGALGWRFTKRIDPDDSNRWLATGFEVFYPDRKLTLALDGIGP